MEGHGKFFGWSRDLFVGESVWRFLCEGDELGDFCQGFDMVFTVLLVTIGMVFIYAVSVPYR